MQGAIFLIVLVLSVLGITEYIGTRSLTISRYPIILRICITLVVIMLTVAAMYFILLLVATGIHSLTYSK